MWATGIILLGVMFSSAAAAVDSFTASYRNGTNCGSNYSITGREPTETGKYPVFLYMAGTFETYNNAAAMAAITGMANRGYVAATVNYPNSSFGNCSTLGNRSKCIFNPSSSNSAISKICARAKADCSKGVVVAGFSQGSILAILAKNYDSRVAAAYGMGAGVQYSSYDLRACVADGKRTLTSDRLRAISGEADTYGGGNADAVRGQLQELTGLSCGSTAYSCYRSNNSGWQMVRHSELSDGSADHCYMRRSGDCSGSQSYLDSGWESGTASWGVKANLDWLTNFTAR